MISPDLFKEDVWRLAKEIGVKPKEIHMENEKKTIKLFKQRKVNF